MPLEAVAIENNAALLAPSFMNDSILSLVAYCALMSGTPGPNNVLLASSGANFGYRRTLPLILGINAGVFALTVAMCMGLGKAFLVFPRLHQALSLAALLYLVYLSWVIATSDPAQARIGTKPLSFTHGATFQLVNPKSWMKGATIAAVFLPSAFDTTAGSILVSLIGFAVGFPLISLWTLFGAAVGKFLSSPLRLRVFNGVMGFGLLALAVTLFMDKA
jgi:threonine/homoserine/homoserine lactone efflux protein